MSSSGSHSGFGVDVDDELTLRIALERSKVDTEGSSGSATSPQLPRRRIADAGAGLSRPARSSARVAQSAPLPHHPLPRRPLLRVGSVGASARAARRERQRARERDAAEQSVCRRRGMLAEPDEDERLLAWVYRRSLTTAETDARRLRRKNAKALRLAIEQSEREAARLAKLKRQQDRAVRRMRGLIILFDDSDDDHNSSFDDSDDPPPAADAYSYAGDRKAKGPTRKW